VLSLVRKSERCRFLGGKAAAAAHRRLAELKGVARSIPNETILINTLTLQEAKDSSAIEASGILFQQ